MSALRPCFSRGHAALGRLTHTVQLRMESAPSHAMPPVDIDPVEYSGPSYAMIKGIRDNMISPGYVTYYKEKLLITQGHQQYLWDQKGRRYLDMFGGIVTVSVGHCHENIVDAAVQQLKTLWHTTSIYMHPKIHEYAALLTSKLPDPLKVVYFVNSGSEANDLAIFMARLATKRHEVISLRNGYHGMSPYLMGVTAMSSWRFSVPSGFGCHNAMNPDVYRGEWGGSHCRDSPVQTTRTCSCPEGVCLATDKYVEQLDDVIRYSVAKDGPACFIAEPIQGVGGTVQYPKDYLKKATDLIRSKNGLIISDEVQTGFGRLGSHFWGFESQGIMPDIVSMAKGIGNGFPLAAVVTTKEIAQRLADCLHFNTYGGNPIASAVGIAVLEELDNMNAQERCADVGTYMLLELARLQKKYPQIIGDVRGKGWMIGVEMTDNADERTPMNGEAMNKLFEDLKDNFLLIGKGGFYGNVFRIKPPMCVTKADVDFAISVMDKVFGDHLDRQ